MLLYYYKSEGLEVCDILGKERKGKKELKKAKRSDKEEIVSMFMFPERIDLQNSPLQQWAEA